MARSKEILELLVTMKIKEIYLEIICVLIPK